MKITKLEKRSKYDPNEVVVAVEITLKKDEIDMLDYEGFDLFPDRLIPDLLVFAGKHYKGYIKGGKIDHNINRYKII